MRANVVVVVVSCVLLLTMAVGTLVNTIAIRDARRHEREAACERANEARDAINDRFDRLTALLVSLSDDPTSERATRFRETMAADALALSECSP